MSKLLKVLLPRVSKQAARAFEEAAGDPKTYQAELLRKLITLNKDTAFGKDHGFGNIRDSRDFRKQVPVRDFEGFRPYVDRLLEGQPSILTESSPFLYATTSGTTGKPKLIPVTPEFKETLQDMSRVWLRRAQQDHKEVLNHTILSVVSPAIEGHTDSGAPYGAMSGITYKHMPKILKAQYTLPYEVMELEDYDLRYIVMMRLALETQVSLAVAPNPSTWLRMGKTAADFGENLIRGIRDGNLGLDGIFDFSKLNAADKKRVEIIESKLPKNPKRADELDKAASAAGKLYPKEAWPHLSLIGCWLGGSAGIQAKLLKEYYGDVPLRDLGFRASEAAMTIPFANNTAAGVLANHSNYYEFIPEAEIEEENPTVLEAHELEVGQNYYILLTTASGLYRYDINDVVRVESFYRRSPVIAFIRKGRDMVNLTGEKLHVNQVIEAMDISERNSPVQTMQYRIIPDLDEMRYDLLVELGNGSDQSYDLETFLTKFDFNLADLNNEYYQKRVSRRLQIPRLCIMKPGWAEREKRREVDGGKRETQFKWAVLKLEWDDANKSEIDRFLEARHIPKDLKS